MANDEVKVELLPCPFCSGEPQRDQFEPDGTEPAVCCKACGVIVLGADARERSVAIAQVDALWNARPAPAEDAALIERIDGMQRVIAASQDQSLGQVSELLADIRTALAAMQPRGEQQD